MKNNVLLFCITVMLFLSCFISTSGISFYGTNNNNIWSDGNNIYMGMEDGKLPYFYYKRGVHSLNDTSEINGTYCLRIDYDGSLGVLYDKFVYDEAIKPNNLSIKVKINKTEDTSFTIFWSQSTSAYAVQWIFGAEYGGVHPLEIYMVGKNDSGSTINYFFTDFYPYECDTTYILNVTNIDYKNGTASKITVANATHSQTINNVWLNGWHPVYFKEILDITTLTIGQASNPDLAHDYVYFVDDWTTGTQIQVKTDNVTEIGKNYATLHGTLINDGSPLQNGTQNNHTIKIFYDTVNHSSDHAYGNNVTITGNFYTGDNFSYNLSGLKMGTTYYYATYGETNYTNSSSFSFGNEKNFTTKIITAPVVMTNMSTNVGETNATLHGYLFDDGGEQCKVWFEYGLTDSYGMITSNQTKNTGDTFISASNETLRPNGQQSGGMPHYPDAGEEEYEDIDDIIPDWDDTYLYGNDNGGWDSNSIYFSEISNNEYIHRISVTFVARVTNINNDNCWINCKFQNKTDFSDLTTLGSSKYVYPDSNWHNITFIYTENATGQPFTQEDLNNAFMTIFVYNGNSSYQTRITQVYMQILSNLSNLSVGTLYHYRAVANNTNTTSYGNDSIFLTKPFKPTNMIISNSYAPSLLNITWVKGTGSNTTYIERNTISSWNRGEGTEVYNGTGETYTDTGLVQDKKYYYRIWAFSNWSYNDTTLHQFSRYSGLGYNTTKKIDVAYNGSSTYYTSINALNLTWSRGNNSDREIVVMKNDSYPTSPTDGFVKQNSTNMWYNESNVFSGRYYTIWGYNDTAKVYSLDGLDISWGALGVSVFNESNPSQALSNWNIHIKNRDASETYTAYDQNNVLYLDMLNIPYGEDIAIMVWKDGYKERIIYTDLFVNNFYNFTFYLPANIIPPGGEPGGGPSGNESFSPQLYYIRIIDELTYPIKDANVTFQRYINTTDSYEIMSTLFTDANGYVNLYLVPEVLYKVTISKTGYITEISDYIPPSPDAFGQVPEKVFQLRSENQTAPPPNIEPEEISFTGYIENNTLYLSYIDNMNQTINTTIFIYEINTSTGNISLFGTNITENNSIFQIEFNNVNTSNTYKVFLFYNHTTFGFQKRMLIFQGIYTPATTPDVINNILTILIGTNPFGWSNLLIWFFLVAAMYYADQRDSGKILILLGGLFLFINIAIGFNTTLLSVAGGIIPTLFIVVGILQIWNDSKKKGFA